jgi:hypothetical protein
LIRKIGAGVEKEMIPFLFNYYGRTQPVILKVAGDADCAITAYDRYALRSSRS